VTAVRTGRARRIPGTSRAVLVHVIAARERRLLPVVRETLAQIRHAVPTAELKRAWVQGGQHPGLELAVQHVWQNARPKLVRALAAPLAKQEDRTSAD